MISRYLRRREIIIPLQVILFVVALLAAVFAYSRNSVVSGFIAATSLVISVGVLGRLPKVSATQVQNAKIWAGVVDGRDQTDANLDRPTHDHVANRGEVQAQGGVLIEPRYVPTIIAMCGLLLSVAASLAADSDRNSRLPLIPWMVGVIVFLVSLALQYMTARTEHEDSGLPNLRHGLSIAMKHRDSLLVIGFVSLLAFFLRTYNLSLVPPSIHGDEAEPAVIAMDIATGNSNYGPFVTGWYDLPVLHQYLQAVFLNVFGRNIGSIRLISVIVGTASVGVVFLMGRFIWNVSVGAVASFLMAVNHLHIAYSRIVGYLEPTLGLLLLVFLIFVARRAIPKCQPAPMGLAGVITGMCMYTYFSNRLMLVFGLLLLLISFGQRKISALSIGYFLIGFVVAFGPLLLFHLENPSTFFSRSDAVNVFEAHNVQHTLGRQDASLPKDLIELLTHQFIYATGMFIFLGDVSKYFFESAAFDPITVAICFAGFGLLVTRLRRFEEFTLLSWFLITLIFGGIVSLNPPSAQKLIMALPPYFLAGAIFIDGLRRLISSVLRTNIALAAVPIVGIIGVWQLLWNVNVYFTVYPPRAAGISALQAANRFSIASDKYDAYFMGAPAIYANYSVFRLIDYGVTITELGSASDIKPLGTGHGLVVIALPHRVAELQPVEARFPGGTILTNVDLLGRELYTEYRVPPIQ